MHISSRSTICVDRAMPFKFKRDPWVPASRSFAQRPTIRSTKTSNARKRDRCLWLGNGAPPSSNARPQCLPLAICCSNRADSLFLLVRQIYRGHDLCRRSLMDHMSLV